MRKIFLLLSFLFFTLCAHMSAQTEVPDSVSSVPADSVAKPATPGIPPLQTNLGPKSTPVDVDDNKPRTVLHYYDKHGDPLDEPVMFLATLDTVKAVTSKPLYPLYNGVNVGLNFGDAIFMPFGQQYASFDVWANVSLHNWFFPTLEMGIGFADATPEKQNFTYKTKPSFYAKLGINYNFLYKSNPDYQVFLGLRAGFSSFKYDLTDVTIHAEYWDETQHLSLTGLKATSFYGEALGGIQVKIVSGFSLGWTARWHFRFNKADDRSSRPWFIPGYGGSSPFAMTVSAIWTIPGPKRPQTEGE